MDRNDPDIVGMQTTFIRTMVKPCFEALSVSSFIIDKNSVVTRQLDQNLLIWEETTVDANGELLTPDLDTIRNKLPADHPAPQTSSAVSPPSEIKETDTLIGTVLTLIFHHSLLVQFSHFSTNQSITC